MALDYHRLKSWPFPEIRQEYTERDTMLYALSLGLGADPLDESALRFVYEKNLLALPTMAVILGYPGFWIRQPESGLDWVKAVQGEQGLELHRPLPPSGTILARTRISGIIDKGAAKGAVILTERTVREAGSGEVLATLTQTTFCRGDGGYSAGDQPSDPPPPSAPAHPEGPPDVVREIATRPEAALLYRLLADRNPLHAEPAVAKKAGYPRPILHGLVTYALAGYVVFSLCGGGDPARLKRLNARFSSPVFPGETLRVELWPRPERVFVRVKSLDRDVVVLTNAWAELS